MTSTSAKKVHDNLSHLIMALIVRITGEMTLAATLEQVKFEWPSDRSVKIHIRGATLTFSV